MPHFKWTAAALAVLISIAACDSAVTPRPQSPAIGALDTSPWQLPALPAPAQVVVALSTAELSVGQSAHASATALTEDGNIITGRTVTWSSDDSSVATVDNDGLVQGAAAGSTRIVATIGGVTGAAAVHIIAGPPTPTVASVSVALTRTFVSPGETAEATVTARDAMGNVVAGQPVAWTSSNPRVATVSGSGVVTAGSPGTASITATVGGVSGQATIAVATADPPGVVSSSPSPGHPNEPAGFTQLSPTVSGDSLPLSTFGLGAAYELGWLQNGTLTQQIDSDVPFASKKVLQAFFPPGFIGGSGPTHMWPASSTNPQNWTGATPPHNARQLYVSFWYKISPGFPINLVANKIIYQAANGDHVAVGTMLHASADYPLDANGNIIHVPNGATQYNAAVVPEVGFNGVEIDGKPVSGGTHEDWFGVPTEQQTQVVRGRWHHFETLYILESDGGHGDGSAFLWLDGILRINWDKRIRFYPTTTTPTPWKWAEWTTVYGGGGSVPNDGIGGYHRMKDLYVSGK